MKNVEEGTVNAYDLWRFFLWDMEDAHDAPFSSVLFQAQEEDRLREQCVLLRRK